MNHEEFAAWLELDDARRAATMAAGKRRLTLRHKEAVTSSCGRARALPRDVGVADAPNP